MGIRDRTPANVRDKETLNWYGQFKGACSANSESSTFFSLPPAAAVGPRNTRESQGHKSPIERGEQLKQGTALAAFRTDWPRREEAIKTSGRGSKPATQPCVTNRAHERQEQVLLNNAGWKARKHLATEMYFVLEKYCPHRSSILLSSEFVEAFKRCHFPWHQLDPLRLSRRH